MSPPTLPPSGGAGAGAVRQGKAQRTPLTELGSQGTVGQTGTRVLMNEVTAAGVTVGLLSAYHSVKFRSSLGRGQGWRAVLGSRGGGTWKAPLSVEAGAGWVRWRELTFTEYLLACDSHRSIDVLPHPLPLWW